MEQPRHRFTPAESAARRDWQRRGLTGELRAVNWRAHMRYLTLLETSNEQDARPCPDCSQYLTPDGYCRRCEQGQP